MWFLNEKAVKEKENRVCVKLYDDSRNFLFSANIPSQYYPLNGDYEMFHCKNTIEITDESMIKAFDSVEYKIGKCYTNTKSLVDRFAKDNIKLVPYCGWLFVGGGQAPIHHCWAVLKSDAGNSILDLGDDNNVILRMIYETGQAFPEKSMRDLYVMCLKEALKFQNSVRCMPLGIPAGNNLYIGAPCPPEKGRIIWNTLLQKYPDHKSANDIQANNMTRMQQRLKLDGLM